MKSIQRKDFLEVGSVVKVHGTKGELKFALSRTIKLKEWAFLEFRGKPVPFYVQSTKAEFDDEIVLRLQGIDSIEMASPLIGKTLLLPKKNVGKEEEDDSLHVEDYLIIDAQYGELGRVLEMVEYPYQTLAKIIWQSREVLVPMVDEIVLEINDKKKTVLVQLPEGLLEIN